MKILTLLLTVLSFTIFSFSQSEKLTSKRWFAISIELNSNDNETANNNIEIPTDYINFPFAFLDFSITGFVSISNYSNKNCQFGFTSHVTYTGTNNTNLGFNFVDLTAFNSVTECNSADDDMLNYMSLCNAFFNSNNSFSYFIQDVYGVDYLVITNPNGDIFWFTENPFNWPPNDITQNTWYLHKIIIDAQDIVKPNFSGEDFSDIELNLYNYYNENSFDHVININNVFSTSACSSINSVIQFNPGTSDFYIYDLTSTTSECGNTTNNNFSNQYLDLFANNNQPGAFLYEINNDILTITNSANNKAVYGRSALSYEENTVDTKFEIYPNPVSNYLNINLGSDKIDAITVFSILGQKVLSTNTSKISFSHLTNGIYIVEIFTTNGNKYTRKIAKIDS